MPNKKATPKPLSFSIENVDSSLIEVLRDEYQKPLNEKRVSQIAAEFDERVANEPKVSYRNGNYFVFDGQHTIAARVMRNGGKPLKIRCKVYRDLTPEQEALLFATQTGFAAKPTPGNRLRARIYAKDKMAIDFRDETECCGFLLDLDGSRSDYHINCINTAMRMFRKLTKEQYRESLDIIRMAWNGKSESLLNEVFVSVCEFVRHYDGQYNRNTLIEALRQVDPKSISRGVKTDFKHPGFRKYVAQIFEIYNMYCGPKKLVIKF